MSRIDAILRAIAAEPWAILPEKLDAICEFLQLRLELGHFTPEEIRARIGDPPSRPAAGTASQGVAVIPVYGVISQRAPMMGDISGGGGTSTDAVGKAFDQAMAEPAAKAILLDIDSPGGTVHGVAELHTKIRAARGTKPIVAIANSTAASAAYWIASAADEVIVTPTGVVGAIGVYTVHSDISKMLEAEGVSRRVFRAGKFKAEGVDGGPLSDEAAVALQEQVDTIYGMFISAVAAGRGTTAAAVRNGYGQGRAVLARQALDDGMVDGIATFDDTLARLGNPRRAASIGRRPDVEQKRLALLLAGDAPTSAARALMQQGDRVRVRPGKEHDPMMKGKSGTVREVSTPALGIEFDGMKGTHKWHVEEELEKL